MYCISEFTFLASPRRVSIEIYLNCDLRNYLTEIIIELRLFNVEKGTEKYVSKTVLDVQLTSWNGIFFQNHFRLEAYQQKLNVKKT